LGNTRGSAQPQEVPIYSEQSTSVCANKKDNAQRALVSLSFHHSQPTISSRPHLFPAHEMADQSASPRFHALVVSALQAYESKTGVTLAQYPLAVQLQSCHSEDDITDLLQGRAKAFDIFQEKDRMLKAIKVTVSILTPLSMAASLADAVGLVRQKAPVACSTSLTPFPDIIPTCESSTGCSRYPTRCMYLSLAHM